MLPQHPVLARFACLLITVAYLGNSAIGFQVGVDPITQQNNLGAPGSSGPSNNSDGFANSTPVMTFVDQSGQPYGRYVKNESVPVGAYSYQQVLERVYVPKTVTKERTITQTQYTPVYSYQPQLRNIYSWNPFAPPQQVWQYVPIVQYQPNYVQVVQPVTYQEYEAKDVPRMIPVFETKSELRSRFVDLPLATGPSGSNAIANNPNAFNNNPYQQAAQIAQANRNTSRFPTRPIDYPYANPGYLAQQYAGPQHLVAQAPLPYYPNPSILPNSTNTTAGYPTNTVIPSVPLRPGPANSIASNPNGYGYGYSNFQTPTYQQPFPAPAYSNVASRPILQWPLRSGNGSLFGSSLFNSNRNPSYVATNTPAGQPYLWGNNTQSEIGRAHV